MHVCRDVSRWVGVCLYVRVCACVRVCTFACMYVGLYAFSFGCECVRSVCMYV